MTSFMKKPSLKIRMKTALLSAAGRVLLAFIRMFSKLPDSLALPMIRFVEWIVSRQNADSRDPNPVKEVREIMESSAKENRAVRNILGDNRTSDAVSMLRGVFKHHLIPRPLPFDEFNTHTPGLYQAKSRFKVGIIGDGAQAQWLARQYQARADVNWIGLEAKDKSKIEKLITSSDGIEVWDFNSINDDLLGELFSGQLAVSVHPAAIIDAKTAKQILTLAKTGGAPFRMAAPYLYYAPVMKAFEMIQDDVIGDVSMLRIRAAIGKGGKEKPAPMPKKNVLSHEAFDHFLLMIFFAGPAQKVASYINPFRAKKGGQALVNFKFERDGRYGLLECALAPELYIRSDHFPYDFEAEITGTDGIIWIRRGMGERTQSAPISVRVGKSAYTVGVETGMPVNWDQVYVNMAGHFVQMMESKQSGYFDSAAILSAYRAKERAYESEKVREVVAV